MGLVRLQRPQSAQITIGPHEHTWLAAVQPLALRADGPEISAVKRMEMRRLFHGVRSIALTGRQAPLAIASCTRVPPIPLKGRQGVGAFFDHTAVRTYQVRGHVSSEGNGTPNGAPPFMSPESVRSAAALQEVTEEILSEGPLIYCILITHGEPPEFIKFEVTVRGCAIYGRASYHGHR